MSPKDWIVQKIKNGFSNQEIYSMYEQFKVETNSFSAYGSFKRKVRKIRNMDNTLLEEKSDEEINKINEEYNHEKGTRDVETINNFVRTLDQLIEYCKIDLNEWEVVKHVANTWGKDNANWQVKAWFKKREAIKDVTTEDFKNIIEETFKYKPKEINFVYDKPKDNLLEISLPDLHLGQLCWEEETGENFNIKIAKDRYFKTIDHLATSAKAMYNYSNILLSIGNDYFNVNGAANTTFSGTPQSEDGRWQKTFSEGVKLKIDCIEYLKDTFPKCKIDVMIIPGNHDFERVFYLGTALECYYSNDKIVTVDNRPLSRKAYLYGNTFLGFCHSDKEKKYSLPLIYSREFPEYWSKAKFIEIHTGHLHKQRGFIYKIIDEESGIVERSLPSITSTDDWHKLKGYSHIKQGQAFSWSREGGLNAIFNHAS